MIRFLLVRVLQSIPVLFVMSLITFVIINAPPGDYGDYIRTNMITQGNASFAAADAAAERYREEHGLNDPMMVQYFRWIGGIVTRGDFGWSYFYNRPVAEVVGERLPRTIALALTCHLLASVFGIGFGILAATRQYSWIDTGALVHLLPRDDDPALPARADHPLRPRLQAQRAGDRQLLLVAVRRRALELGQVRQPRPAHLAGGLRRHPRRARLQHAGDARRTCSTR